MWGGREAPEAHAWQSVDSGRCGKEPEERETDYVDGERVKGEVKFARRMFADNGWAVIDVTRRSIEETAAVVIRLYNERSASGSSQGPKPI